MGLFRASLPLPSFIVVVKIVTRINICQRKGTVPIVPWAFVACPRSVPSPLYHIKCFYVHSHFFFIEGDISIFYTTCFLALRHFDAMIKIGVATCFLFDRKYWANYLFNTGLPSKHLWLEFTTVDGQTGGGVVTVFSTVPSCYYLVNWTTASVPLVPVCCSGGGGGVQTIEHIYKRLKKNKKHKKTILVWYKDSYFRIHWILFVPIIRVFCHTILNF